MKPITVTRIIEAPVAAAFATIADVRRFAQALPHVVGQEFLSEGRSGPGTRWRETRLMNGRKTTTELEVTEQVQNDRVRIVAVAGGTVWDTTFTTRADGGRTVLTMTMEARAFRLLARLFNILIRGMIEKAASRDMDLVKAFCER